jgi:hypothetical protein
VSWRTWIVVAITYFQLRILLRVSWMPSSGRRPSGRSGEVSCPFINPLPRFPHCAVVRWMCSLFRLHALTLCWHPAHRHIARRIRH